MVGGPSLRSGDRPRALSDAGSVVLAAAVWAGAAVHRPGPLVPAVLGVVLALAVRRPWMLWAAALVVASVMGARAVAGLAPAERDAFAGAVTLVSDPEVVGQAVRVDVRADGRRLQAWAGGEAAARLRLLLAGETVEVSGRIGPLPASAPWLTARHVVGELEVDHVDAVRPGSLLVQAANRLRRTLGRGAASLPERSEALFNGFVLGDDRELSPAVEDDFRGAGLSHLLAVSGQNVAFVLALVMPLTRRLPMAARLTLTSGVLAFFALLTRFEPSVLRATAMAGVAVLAMGLGREASSVRGLALAVSALVLVDPLLVRSVGFQLSVAASAGIVLLSGPLAERLPGPSWFRLPLAVTMAAQAAVAPVLLVTFGGLPVVAVPANLLAAPAAGPITMWGLTAGLLAGVAPTLAPVLHLPTGLLLGWVAGVARTATRLPLGEWGPWHLLALAATGCLGLFLRWRRTALVAVVAVAVLPSLALRSSSTVQPLGPEGRVEQRDGATVVVVGSEARPSALLERLRRAGIRDVDRIVLEERSARASAVVAALHERFGGTVPVAEAPV